MSSLSASAIPRTVWALGFASLLMDVSSEMIHALLPLFMAETLGAGALWIGLVEGLGEGVALLTKVVSGVVADRFGHKKLLVFLGYALGVLSKPVFALAGAMPVVLGARVADRIGKGLRGAPRDALVAEVTPEAVRGAAFGLRQSLDAAGAFVGPLLASALLLFWTDDCRSIFWVALIPGVLCLPSRKARLRTTPLTKRPPSVHSPNFTFFRIPPFARSSYSGRSLPWRVSQTPSSCCAPPMRVSPQPRFPFSSWA